jgi:hypothetical protein
MSCRNAAEANLKAGHSLAAMWQKSGVAHKQQKCAQSLGTPGFCGVFSRPLGRPKTPLETPLPLFSRIN